MSTVISVTARSDGNASYAFTGVVVSVRRWVGAPLLLRAWARFAEWRRRQHAIAALEALDDRHLHDIGIARCEIWYRVNHPQER